LLPIATAMNAVSFFRLFSRLFLGQRRTGFTVMADALPRERWVLAGIVLFMVVGGLFPSAIVIEHSSGIEVNEAARTFGNPQPVRPTCANNLNMQSLLAKSSGKAFIAAVQLKK
jgi:NADH:ubiquinone oxidoreductase subunit 4 (subunit M)